MINNHTNHKLPINELDDFDAFVVVKVNIL